MSASPLPAIANECRQLIAAIERRDASAPSRRDFALVCIRMDAARVLLRATLRDAEDAAAATTGRRTCRVCGGAGGEWDDECGVNVWSRCGLCGGDGVCEEVRDEA